VLADEFGKHIQLRFTSNVTIPDGKKIRVKLAEPNEYFNIDEVAEIKNNQISIEPVFNPGYTTYADVNKGIPEGINSFPVTLDVEGDVSGTVILLKKDIDLRVVNRQVKTLRISVE
jgi:hypothetical protein